MSEVLGKPEKLREVTYKKSLITKFIADAEKLLKYPHTSFTEYAIPNELGNANAILLPPEYAPLVQEFNGPDYWLVYHSDTSDAADSNNRYKAAGISTMPGMYMTNQRIREFEFRQYLDKDKTEFDIGERINYMSILDNPQFVGKQPVMPHGNAKYTYEIGKTGNKKLKSVKYNRLDEGAFDLGQSGNIARWIRNLEVDSSSEEPRVSYSDDYLVGVKNRRGSSDLLSRVEISMTGNIDNPSSIRVEINGTITTADQIIYQDKANNIVVMGPKNWRKECQFLEQDPTYAFLFKDPIDVSQLKTVLSARVTAIREDWDNPQTVFTKQGLDTSRDSHQLV